MSPGTGDDRPPSISHSLTLLTSTAIAALPFSSKGIWAALLPGASPPLAGPRMPVISRQRRPKPRHASRTRVVSSRSRRSGIRRARSSCRLQTPANAAEATTVRESFPAIFSSLAARLTAGPMQVKSSRLMPPILPNRISPMCSATPKRKRSMRRRCGIAHGIDAGARLARRFQHARADRAEIAAVVRDRKHREQAVAHEFQDLAAMLADRGDLAIEILVEDVDHVLAAASRSDSAVKPRKSDSQIAACIALGVAAADLARPDALAGAIADIGVEQRGGGAAASQRSRQCGRSGGMTARNAASCSSVNPPWLLSWSSSWRGSCRR